MYLQLAGHTPLHNAENPLAPGAATYKYDKMYLGQSQDIILPDALFPANVEGFTAALKNLEGLYKKYAEGKKKTPADIVKTPGMSEPLSLFAIAKAAVGVAQVLSTVARGAAVNLARQQITTKYNNNEFNVQNLNQLNARQVAEQITRIDGDIAATPNYNIGKKMALSRFRLVYQQRFDQVSGGGGIGNLPAWVLPAALGLGALLLLRGRK